MTATHAGTSRGWWRSTFASLAVRNYRLFFMGQLISNSGNWLTLVGVTLLGDQLSATGGDLAVEALSLAAMLVGVVLIGLSPGFE